MQKIFSGRIFKEVEEYAILIILAEIMGNLTIDKGLLAMILGPIVGVFVMKGYVDPRNADYIVQSISTIIGGAITIITLGYGIYHDIEFHKLKNQTAAKTPLVTQASTTPPAVTAVTSL